MYGRGWKQMSVHLCFCHRWKRKFMEQNRTFSIFDWSKRLTAYKAGRSFASTPFRTKGGLNIWRSPPWQAVNRLTNQKFGLLGFAPQIPLSSCGRTMGVTFICFYPLSYLVYVPPVGVRIRYAPLKNKRNYTKSSLLYGFITQLIYIIKIVNKSDRNSCLSWEYMSLRKFVLKLNNKSIILKYKFR